MNDLGADFVTFIRSHEDYHDIKELVVTYHSYIQQCLPNISSTILSHINSPLAYEIEEPSDFANLVYNVLSQSQPQQFKIINPFLSIKEYLLFPLYDYFQNVNFVFIFDKLNSTQYSDISNLCLYFQKLYQIVNKHDSFLKSSLRVNNANMISQICHDLNSFISLVKKEVVQNQNIDKKISYLENLSSKILYFLRDCEVMPSSVNIKNFLEAVIENQTVPDNVTLQMSIQNTNTSVSVDVELLNLALNAILENAFRAATMEGNEVSIYTEVKDNISPFIDFDWLQISIVDNGSGIHPDFIKNIKDPFFTTFKSYGNCGLGLPIANKIIEIHNGSIKIENDRKRGTRVTLFLPNK